MLAAIKKKKKEIAIAWKLSLVATNPGIPRTIT